MFWRDTCLLPLAPERIRAYPTSLPKTTASVSVVSSSSTIRKSTSTKSTTRVFSTRTTNVATFIPIIPSNLESASLPPVAIAAIVICALCAGGAAVFLLYWFLIRDGDKSCKCCPGNGKKGKVAPAGSKGKQMQYSGQQETQRMLGRVTAIPVPESVEPSESGFDEEYRPSFSTEPRPAPKTSRTAQAVDGPYYGVQIPQPKPTHQRQRSADPYRQQPQPKRSSMAVTNEGLRRAELEAQRNRQYQAQLEAQRVAQERRAAELREMEGRLSRQQQQQQARRPNTWFAQAAPSLLDGYTVPAPPPSDLVSDYGDEILVERFGVVRGATPSVASEYLNRHIEPLSSGIVEMYSTTGSQPTFGAGLQHGFVNLASTSFVGSAGSSLPLSGGYRPDYVQGGSSPAYTVQRYATPSLTSEPSTRNHAAGSAYIE